MGLRRRMFGIFVYEMILGNSAVLIILSAFLSSREVIEFKKNFTEQEIG